MTTNKKLTYTNRKGTLYYFREVTGKRGVRIVCSQKMSKDDLDAIPDTHEIAETPNGQVSCRKKMKSDFLLTEVEIAKELAQKLAKKNARIIVEVKKKTILLHSASTDSIQEMIKYATSFGQNLRNTQAILEKQLYFEPVLKLELSDKKNRTFTASRMCWIGGENDWLFLEDGALIALLKKYVPHIEQESFFEQI